MVEKICGIVLYGLRGVFDQHKDLLAEKNRVNNVKARAMSTPGVSAVVSLGSEGGFREQEAHFLGMASGLFFVLQETMERKLILLAEDRKQIATELQKLNSDFPDNQIRASLKGLILELSR